MLRRTGEGEGALLLQADSNVIVKPTERNCLHGWIVGVLFFFLLLIFGIVKMDYLKETSQFSPTLFGEPDYNSSVSFKIFPEICYGLIDNLETNVDLIMEEKEFMLRVKKDYRARMIRKKSQSFNGTVLFGKCDNDVKFDFTCVPLKIKINGCLFNRFHEEKHGGKNRGIAGYETKEYLETCHLKSSKVWMKIGMQKEEITMNLALIDCPLVVHPFFVKNDMFLLWHVGKDLESIFLAEKSWEVFNCFVADMMWYIHQEYAIWHCDLSGEQVFLLDDTLKILDFGYGHFSPAIKPEKGEYRSHPHCSGSEGIFQGFRRTLGDKYNENF